MPLHIFTGATFKILGFLLKCIFLLSNKIHIKCSKKENVTANCKLQTAKKKSKYSIRFENRESLERTVLFN